MKRLGGLAFASALLASTLALAGNSGNSPPRASSGGGAVSSVNGSTGDVTVAPVGAKYIVQTADATLTNEQALGALSSGPMFVTTTTGAVTALTTLTGLTSTSSALTVDLTTGKAGGQTLAFDTASGGVGTVTTTAHATKGTLTFGSSSFGMTWIESNTASLGSNYILALGTATQGFAGATLSAGGSRAGEAGPWLWNSSSSTVAQTSIYAGQSASGSGVYARVFQLGTGFTPAGVLIANSGGLEHQGNTGNLVIGKVGSAGDIVAATTSSRTERMRWYNGGSVTVGTGLTTGATDGDFYVPSCAGVPTGVPAQDGNVKAIRADRTNNKLYLYSGGAWVALNYTFAGSATAVKSTLWEIDQELLDMAPAWSEDLTAMGMPAPRSHVN